MAGGDRSLPSGDRRRQICWTDSIHVTILSRLGQIPRPKPAETNLPAAAHGGEEAFGADPSRSRTTESCKILKNTRGTRNTILFAPQRTQRPSSPERCGGGAWSERSSGKKKWPVARDSKSERLPPPPRACIACYWLWMGLTPGCLNFAANSIRWQWQWITARSEDF
jgi:hypothetical protein